MTSHSPSTLRPAMDLAIRQSRLSDCDRAFVGCVIMTWAGVILVAAHNRAHMGNGKGISCKTHKHHMVDGHCVRTIHAEQACIMLGLQNSFDFDKTVAVVTHTPCAICTPLLIEAGVKAVYIKNRYRETPETYKWFQTAKVEVMDWNSNKIVW